MSRQDQIKAVLWAVGKAMNMNWLKGKKTYIIGICGIIGTVGAWVAGSLTTPEAIGAIMAALSTMSIRSAITTEAAK